MADQSVVRRGMRLVRELTALHPGPFSLAVIGAAVYAGATVGSTIVLGRVTDEVIYPTYESGRLASSALWWAIAAIAAITVLRISGVVTRRYFAGMTSERGQRTLRHRLVDKYLGLPLAWHRRTPTGQLLAHADNDTEVTTELLHPLPFSLGVAFLALFAAASLLVVDLALALLAFMVFPALTVLNHYYSRRIEAPSAEVQAGVGAVSSIAHESFDGALIVKTLGRAEAEGQRFSEAATALRAKRIHVGYIRAVFESIMDALPSIGMVLVVVFGTYRIESGAITRGDLVQVAALFSVLALPMRVLGFFLEMVPPSVVSRERLNLVFDEPDPEQAQNPVEVADGPLSLQVDHLSFSYDVGPVQADGAVLSDVTFSIAEGEVVALVGSTGSGKSTLCRLLAGLMAPDSGTIKLGNVPLENLEPNHRSNVMALVFQESFLFADSLRSNIDLSDEATDADISRAAAVAQVDGFVAELPAGYDTVIGERGVTLSGGQRQRVALARALIREPRFLVLDDATSAVDAKIEQRILAGLRSELSTTSLIVAQRISTIELADRVLYLSRGRIVAQGQHRELMEHPGYEALVRAYEVASR